MLSAYLLELESLSDMFAYSQFSKVFLASMNHIHDSQNYSPL